MAGRICGVAAGGGGSGEGGGEGASNDCDATTGDDTATTVTSSIVDMSEADVDAIWWEAALAA
jgi:hypothetical protein